MHEQLAEYSLARQQKAIQSLKDLSGNNILFVDWYTETAKLIKKIFGDNSIELNEFERIRFKRKHPYSFFDQSDADNGKTPKEIYQAGLETAEQFLLSLQCRL